MFTCPDKEIHSVYLDGELPSPLIADYEAHVASCASCQKELSALRSVREVLAADAASIKFSDEYIEESWARLNERRRYSEVVSHTRPAFGEGFGRVVWRVVPAAAAAAVIAVVLPLRMTRASSAGTAQQGDNALLAGMSGGAGVNGGALMTGALAQNKSSPLYFDAVNGAWFDDSAGLASHTPQAATRQPGQPFDNMRFDSARFYDMQSGNSASTVTRTMGQNAAFGSGGMALADGSPFAHGAPLAGHGAAGLANHGRHGMASMARQDSIVGDMFASTFPALGSDIAAVDVFRPDLDDEGKTISIRISVPGITGERAYTTIRIPVSELQD